jgi:hypothetical protein
MQHPEEYGRSAKSYFQHLTALCCGLEHPADVHLYWSIAPLKKQKARDSSLATLRI